MKQQLLIERQLSGTIKLSQIETEKLVAYMVNEELNKRKREGTYKGAFGPVTHFFGYQGRSGHPSMFDCSLASTMGFTAAALIQHKLTGLVVTVNNVTAPASDWRCGGVPIIALMDVQPRAEFKKTDLVVPSENVDLSAKTF
jgi:pyrophosphate--fructose-6-phosphate 1-phosphotransferase